jgi:hypothetical protein
VSGRRRALSIPKATRERERGQGVPEVVLIPKGKGVLPVRVPELHELAGIVKGAKTRAVRDRKDRY